MMGMAGSSNVQGEDQKKLDIVANEVFKNSLRRSGQCCILVGSQAGVQRDVLGLGGLGWLGG